MGFFSFLFFFSFNSFADCGPVPPGMIQATDCSLRAIDLQAQKAFAVVKGTITKVECANASFQKKFYTGEISNKKIIRGLDYAKIKFKFMLSNPPKEAEPKAIVGQYGEFAFVKDGKDWNLRGAKPENQVTATLPECVK
jgi:hypothetical protein